MSGSRTKSRRSRRSSSALAKEKLVGPVAVSDGLLVAEILAKLPVDSADPAVRARATDAVVERAVRREADAHVVWHEPL